MLLRRGADAAAEDKNKSDAAFLAKKAGFHECRQILSLHIKERIATLSAQAVHVRASHSQQSSTHMQSPSTGHPGCSQAASL